MRRSYTRQQRKELLHVTVRTWLLALILIALALGLTRLRFERPADSFSDLVEQMRHTLEK